MKLLLENWRRYLNEAAKGISDLAPDAQVYIDVHDTGFEVGLDPVGLISVEVVPGCKGLYSVHSADADDNWGPFLYDIAMEWASSVGVGLTPDKEMSISQEAIPVWEYYFNKRPDVEKLPMPEGCEARTRMRGPNIPGGGTYDVPDFLNLVYRKPKEIIPQLEKSGNIELPGQEDTGTLE